MKSNLSNDMIRRDQLSRHVDEMNREKRDWQSEMKINKINNNNMMSECVS